MSQSATKADFARAQREALKLLDKFELNTPPIDPENVAEFLGITVTFVDFSNNDISGFFDNQLKEIVVNKAEDSARNNFTIAHELGHAVLHQHLFAPGKTRFLHRKSEYDPKAKKPPEEQEADAFAAHLLVPFRVLNRYVGKANQDELADLFQVSKSMMRNRLKVLR